MSQSATTAPAEPVAQSTAELTDAEFFVRAKEAWADFAELIASSACTSACSEGAEAEAVSCSNGLTAKGH
mgnify:CR=1 FL=1